MKYECQFREAGFQNPWGGRLKCCPRTPSTGFAFFTQPQDEEAALLMSLVHQPGEPILCKQSFTPEVLILGGLRISHLGRMSKLPKPEIFAKIQRF